MISNDEIIVKWSGLIKRLSFILENEGSTVIDDNIPDWMSNWQEEINQELIVLENDYPHLIHLIENIY